MRDGGILTIYSLENVGEDGFMPQEKLVPEGTAFFSYMTIGVTRMYAALGANRGISKLVRCWNTDTPEEGKYVIIDDVQYRIDVAQSAVDEDAVDLTLVRLEDFYDVAIETETDGGSAEDADSELQPLLPDGGVPGDSVGGDG